MAKATTNTDSAPQILIEAYKPAEREGVYDAHVQALLDAEPNFPEGEYPAVTLQVPNGTTNAKGEYMERAKQIRFFQESAKRVGRTARLVDNTPRDNRDGSSTLKFVLREAIKRARKPKDESATLDKPAVNDTPEDAAA